MSKRQGPPGLFITGTNTEVGKTVVAARIAEACVRAGIRVGVYKPAASGCRREAGQLIADDALTLWQAAGEPGTLEAVCPQRFELPLAPNVAAREVGKHVDPELLRSGVEYWRERSDLVLVEGAGGLLSPLSDEDFVADVAADLGYPLIVVSPNILGTINQTLQTLITAAVFREGLDVAGIVINHPVPQDQEPSSATNRQQLEQHAVPPVLTELRWNAEAFDPPRDWLAVARGTEDAVR